MRGRSYSLIYTENYLSDGFLRRRVSSRRSILHTLVGIFSLSIAGCTSSTEQPSTATSPQTTSAKNTAPQAKTGIGSPSESRSPTTTTAQPPEEIRINVFNDVAEERTVSLTVSRNNHTFMAKEFDVESDGNKSVNSGINEVGQYMLSIAVGDNLETEYQFDISGYDLRMGSSLLVEISKNRIQTMITE